MASDLAKEVVRLHTDLAQTQAQTIDQCNIIINLMDEMERVRQNWATAEGEKEQLNGRISSLELDAEQYQSRIKTLQAELKDARSQVREQLQENGALKSDLEDLVKRLKVVQELVQSQKLQTADSRLQIINQPMLFRTNSLRMQKREIEEDDTSSSIDYDRTEDSFEVTLDRPAGRSRPTATMSRSRRSASVQPRLSHSKRSRLLEEVEPVPHKKSRDMSKTPCASSSSKSTTRTLRNRSMSESSLAVENDECKMRLEQQMPKTTSTLDLRMKPKAPFLQSWTRGEPIACRPHHFEKVSTYLKLTVCDVCSSGINFAGKPAVKCSDCQQIIHISCKKRLPLPCVPRNCTPVKTPRKDGHSHTLTEFCPPTVPMIPYPIVHLVVALEKRGLEVEGIYRVPGAKAQVTRTLNELRTSRAIPNLDMQHVEILSDSIKQFLRELRDPLIPKSSREEFIRAARNSDKAMLNTAICDLPQPNRDTLSYLIIHWQKVISLADINKMPKENVARCVAMSVMMGQRQYGDLAMANKETGECERVLMELISFPSEYWMRFLTPNAVQRPSTLLPERELSGADSSMLGPVSSACRPSRPPSRPRRFFEDP